MNNMALCCAHGGCIPGKSETKARCALNLWFVCLVHLGLKSSLLF